MAWGLWNKIKQGFKKVGNFVKKAASFVNDKVIKPFKPVIKNVANAIIPGSGKFVEIQATGEQHPFDASQLSELMMLAGQGCQQLIDLQNQVLE